VPAPQAPHLQCVSALAADGILYGKAAAGRGSVAAFEAEPGEAFDLDRERLSEILDRGEEAAIEGLNCCRQDLISGTEDRGVQLMHLLMSGRSDGWLREPAGYRVNCFSLHSDDAALLIVEHDSCEWDAGRICGHSWDVLDALDFGRGELVLLDLLEEAVRRGNVLLRRARLLQYSLERFA
jgi:hypothetical protein